MADYADWTESIELLGSEIQVPFDLQGAYIQMPMDIQASYIQVPVDIQGQYVTLDIRIVASDITLNVNISSQTANINVNLAASDITLNVAIQSSATTLNVNITGQTLSALNVNITGSVATLNVNITGSTATLNVNITGTTGNVNINLNAQSVAIKSQGEWAPQAGQQKYPSSGVSGVSIGANIAQTIFYYPVTSGKTFYMTHASFMVFDSAAGTPAGLPVGIDIEDYNPSAGTSTKLAFLGGNGGGSISFPTPVKVAGDHIIYVHGYNSCEMSLSFYASFGGYEL